MSRLPMMLLVAAVAFGVQPEPAATPAAATTYVSHDGDFAFEYPADWSLHEAPRGGFSHVARVAASTECCALDDGDVKIDFAVLDARTARALRLTYEARCAGSRWESSVSCRRTVVRGTQWGWVLARSAESRSLYAMHEHGGRVIVAVGVVSEGPAAPHGIAELERIFRTFEAR
jgi:hypothetical protein